VAETDGSRLDEHDLVGRPTLSPAERARFDFEIGFFEGVLEAYPDYLEVLELLAENYTQVGNYEKGLAADLQLAKVKPNDPTVLYNLACSYSLVGDIDQALWTLSGAIQAGYRDFNYLARDPDLDSARRDPRFQQFLAGHYFSAEPPAKD